MTTEGHCLVCRCASRAFFFTIQILTLIVKKIYKSKKASVNEFTHPGWLGRTAGADPEALPIGNSTSWFHIEGRSGSSHSPA
ncbi:MAG: hypothetical protein R6U50_07620 [Desulfobacterales bacterium]